MRTNLAAVMDEPRPAGLVSVEGKTFPLLSAQLAGRAEGGVACTTLTQTYGNPYAEPLEVLYTLALPAGGAVVACRVRIGDKVIEGEIRPRAEAEKEYQDAIMDGRTAALLEQHRADTFSQRLGALPAGEEAAVEITVLQPLEFVRPEGNGRAEWEYRFPTVVGVRYEGEPGRVPDRELLDADRAGGEGTPVRLELGLLLVDGPAGEIEPNSPSHELDVQGAEGGARVTLGRATRLDRDVVVRWRAAAPEVGVRLTEGAGIGGDDGRYCLVTITPPEVADHAFQRDVIYLIDASGSMSGFPIEQVKRLVAANLATLDPGDRFEILAFAKEVNPLVRRPTEATKRNVDSALAALRKLEAGGSTEMTKAIKHALAPLREGSQRQVILLTDGQIGFEGEVVAEVAANLPAGARLHAVGVGGAPNRSLTRAASRAGRGVEVLITSEEDAKDAARRLCRATTRPVLTEIAVGGGAVKTVATPRPVDVLAGQPLVVAVELNPAGGTLTVRGNLAGSSEPWVRAIEVAPAVAPAASAIPIGALFGREVVEEAETRLAGRPGAPAVKEIEREIERLGMRHRIVTRFTSMVAFALEPSVDPKAPRRRERLPLEIPAGVSAEGVGLLCASADEHFLLSKSRSPRVHLDYALSAAPPAAAEPALLRSLKGWLEKLRERQPAEHETRLGRGLEIHGAHLLRVEGDLLVLEFEVPEDGFLLPGDRTRIEVRFADGTRGSARVVGSGSSPAGPHARGFVVRLALHLERNHDSDPTRSVLHTVWIER